jgi:hypothetical protein
MEEALNWFVLVWWLVWWSSRLKIINLYEIPHSNHPGFRCHKKNPFEWRWEHWWVRNSRNFSSLAFCPCFSVENQGYLCTDKQIYRHTRAEVSAADHKTVICAKVTRNQTLKTFESQGLGCYFLYFCEVNITTQNVVPSTPHYLLTISRRRNHSIKFLWLSR